MATYDQLPQARVVRSHGQYLTPPPAPPPEPGMLAQQLRGALALALGLWPLTAALLLMVGLFVLVGRFGSP